MTDLSTCCDAPPWLETDLCSSCKEHTEFYDDDVIYCPECGSENVDLLPTRNVDKPLLYLCADCWTRLHDSD